jgi:hypothetical protein
VVGGVDVHVVLLGGDAKVAQSARELALAVGDLDLVLLDVVGMGDELAADEELELRRVAERVAHPAMEPGDPDAALDRVEQARELAVGDRAHRPDRHDQAQAAHRLAVREGVERRGDLDREALRAQRLGAMLCERLGLVAFPATPDDQRVRRTHRAARVGSDAVIKQIAHIRVS